MGPCSRRKVRALPTFPVETAAELPGADWFRDRRRRAAEHFASIALPSESEEVWRYSRIDDLDLDRFRPLSPDGPVADDVAERIADVMTTIGPRAGAVWLRNGRVVSVELDESLAAKGVTLGPLAAAGTTIDGVLGAAVREQDAFTTLNDALVDDGVHLHVPAGVIVDRPVVIAHWIDADGSAVFPRLLVTAGATAEVSILDFVGGDDVAALVVPVVELHVGDAANVSYLNTQELGRRCWQIGYQGSEVGRDAHLRSGVMALGGEYARIRTDSKLVGEGGTSNLLAVYFGDREQVHDFRTLQDHAAPQTTSDLLFKGAVAGTARSVYSGLIRVRQGAAGTNAFQTNRNLVLSDGAHADSVPNLQIEENDVRCSHASAVGPVDADQRFYLEARGIPTDVAERLILLGFFDEIIDRLPIPALHGGLRARLSGRLAVLDDLSSLSP